MLDDGTHEGATPRWWVSLSVVERTSLELSPPLATKRYAMGNRRHRPEPEPKEPSPATEAARAMIEESRELSAKPPKTSIHRVDPETGDRKFVARVSTDLATEEWIAKKFGPGKYALTHQIVGETGSYKYHSNDTFLIDESSVAALEPGEDSPAAPAAGASSPAVVAPGANILERAMEAGVLRLLEQSARHNDLAIAMVQRITEATDRPRGPSLVELITAAAPIIKALIERKPEDSTRLAIELAGLLNKNNNAGGTLEALERGISIATKLGASDRGSSEDAGGMLPVVGEGIRVLGGIVDSIVNERRAARGENGPPAGEPVATVDGKPPLTLVPNEPTPPTTAGASSSDRLWISVARPQLPALLAAARFIPPGAAAETIAANLSPAALEDLLADVNDQTPPGFAGRLAAVFPQLSSINPQWFTEMLRTLLEMTAEEPEETPAPAATARGKGK